MRRVTRANVGTVMRRLYDAGIEVSVTWSWEGGVQYRIEDGVPVEAACDADAVEAIQAIAEQAHARYPDSVFAKWWSGPRRRAERSATADRSR
jgi:rhamnogalacturonyl hydrolase YesR